MYHKLFLLKLESWFIDLYNKYVSVRNLTLVTLLSIFDLAGVIDFHKFSIRTQLKFVHSRM
jgi:hypothetical protein